MPRRKVKLSEHIGYILLVDIFLCGNQKLQSMLDKQTFSKIHIAGYAQLLMSVRYYPLHFFRILTTKCSENNRRPNRVVSVQILILIRSPTISLEYKINIIVVRYFVFNILVYM